MLDTTYTLLSISSPPRLRQTTQGDTRTRKSQPPAPHVRVELSLDKCNLTSDPVILKSR